VDTADGRCHRRDRCAAQCDDHDPDAPAVKAGLNWLRRECVDAKEALSSDVDVVVPVALPGLADPLRVARAEFEDLIRPALADTVPAMERGLRSAGTAPTELTAIVLVGGYSTHPPRLRDALQRLHHAHGDGTPIPSTTSPWGRCRWTPTRPVAGRAGRRGRPRRPPSQRRPSRQC